MTVTESEGLAMLPTVAVSRRRFLQQTAAAGVVLGGPRSVWAGTETDRVPLARVECEGRYRRHLQGVCSDGRASIYWSFTDELVRTDAAGKVVKKVPAANHHGDLCYRDGKVYVAVNLGKFNQPAGQADSWVYVYDAETLKELARHEVPEVVHGAGGMDTRNGRYFVVGGLPEGIEENYVYEYDGEFRFVKRHVVSSGYTLMGIQTATFFDDHWWFGCYGRPAELVKTDAKFQFVGKWKFDCSLGLIGLEPGKFLAATGAKTPDGYTGVLRPAVSDEMAGLRLVKA